MAPHAPVPILLYHRLGTPPRGARVPGQYVSPRRFRRHLAFLRARGYHSLPLLALATPEAALPPKPVVITFDDGYAGLHRHALPALTELGFQATVFMVAEGIGGLNSWETAIGDVEESMLSLAQLQEMRQAGVEIGSHTLRHPHLTALPPAQMAQEIGDSRRRLEDQLGTPCLSFAYPYGDWNRTARDLVEKAGYRVACITRRAVARATDDRLALPRINIRRHNTVPYFAYKLWRAGR
jgi:peptidoglycan/xylan/chitin deacetylase (PgdA/CDA1 family)